MCVTRCERVKERLEVASNCVRHLVFVDLLRVDGVTS